MFESVSQFGISILDEEMSSPTSSQRFVELDGSQLGAANAEDYERGDGEGIPFLVTHWLEHFANVGNQELSSQEQAEAFEKIRRATSDLASAFSTLGAYGTINAVSLSTPNLCRGASSKSILFHIFCFHNFFNFFNFLFHLRRSRYYQLRIVNTRGKGTHHILTVLDNGPGFLKTT